MSGFKAKNAPKSNFSWRSAHTLLGELTALHQTPQRISGFAFMRYINPRLTLTLTLAGFKGPTSKGGEWK